MADNAPYGSSCTRLSCRGLLLLHRLVGNFTWYVSASLRRLILARLRAEA